jgi:hypothetical protein
MKRLPSIAIFFSEFDKNKEVEVTQESVKVAMYSGSILFSELSKWLDMFILETIEGKKGAGKIEIEQISSGYKFDSCKDYKLCVYVYVSPDEAHKENDAEENWRAKIGILRRIKDLYGSTNNVNVMWIDAMCFIDVLGQLGIGQSQVPGVFAYDHGKDKKFVFSGDLNYENVDRFVARSLRGADEAGAMVRGLELPKRNCYQFKKENEKAKASEKDL